MREQPIIYGTAVVGTKGQIVIPAEARKRMGIKPGDKLVVIPGPPFHKRIISLIPEDEFAKLLSMLSNQLMAIKRKQFSGRKKS
ncbi:MAG: AbrB/MazE/SpoVT family DNA-binding domain-containing protein [Candidatus Aureabacteria bacterium]|nr:AbrB/MazE/SpoVT family DNA-binding domain-containing protein [Candidatus Auribacterota bacterium]